MLRHARSLVCALALILAFAPPSAFAEDEKKEAGPRLGMMVFGPEETGYPFATMEGNAADLKALHFQVRDAGGKALFEFDAPDGSTLVYDLAVRAGEDDAGRTLRANRSVELITARFRAAGYFDAQVRAEAGGRLRVHIPAHSIDGGAPLATLVSSSGSLELAAEVGAKAKLGWHGTKAEYLAYKKSEAARWRAAQAEGRTYVPADPRYRLALSGAHDGSQPYHFKLLETNVGGAAKDRSLFDKIEVVDDEDDGWLLRLRFAKGKRAAFDAWHAALGSRGVALVVHGRHYATLTEDDITDEGLAIPVQGHACRPLADWAGDLGRSLHGAPLPGEPRLRARVNLEAGPKGSFAFYAPMTPGGVLTVEVSAPGEAGVEAVTRTRRHKHGHFVKYYFITMSYLGARHCGDLPVELAVWTKYQETELLTFNVGITLTHYGTSPLAIMAAHMLALWREDNPEVMRRLTMGLAMEQAERRWAACRGIALRGVRGELGEEEGAKLLAPLLEDKVERVRIAAALGRLQLGEGGDADRALLAAGAKSKDPWVQWAAAQAPKK